MTRFNITLDQGVDMVIWAICNSLGSEILVPKLPSYRISDIAEAIGPNCSKEIIGLRPGEKIHEEMITSADSYSTLDLGKYYAILPDFEKAKEFLNLNHEKCDVVEKNFNYNSKTNPYFLSIEEIRSLISNHLDPFFKPI